MTLVKPIMPDVVHERTLPVDILNRQEFVDNFFELIETLSTTRSSCTIALNGKWGAGKTFVLELLERQLREYLDGERYIAFHYNCWKYDYYEEPLIAIVSAMLDNIDEQTHIFKEGHQEKLRQGVELARPILQKIIDTMIKNKFGVDPSDVITELHEAQKVASDLPKEGHDYDQYFTFKKVLDEAKKDLLKLTKDKMLVVVVDELDRCLPEYAITILERLHHLFSGLDSTAVILGIDRAQLDYSIKKIFGKDIDTGTYLKKFIDLEMELGLGTIDNRFREKYGDYLALFDENLLKIELSMDKFFSALFANIEIRTQEHLIERIKTIHRLLFKEEKKDYSFLCFELMLTRLFLNSRPKEVLFDIDHSHGSLLVDFNDERLGEFAAYITQSWTKPGTICMLPQNALMLSESISLLELLVWYYQEVFKSECHYYRLSPKTPRQSEFEMYIEDFRRIEQMLAIIQ